MSARKRNSPKPPDKPAAVPPQQRQLSFHDEFFDDLEYWMRTDARIALRVWRLVRETMREPMGGIGKPEPLRHLRGTWSRRITGEHRLTYRVYDDHVDFLGARYHYS